MPGALALDLSTHCGWAYAGPDALAVWPRCGSPLELVAAGPFPAVRSGTWELGRSTHGEVAARFRARLGAFLVEHRPSHLWFERPLVSGQHKGGDAAALAFGLALIVQEVAVTGRKVFGPVAVQSLHLSTVKKHFTGSGKAKKPDMIAAAQARGWAPTDDNQADALAVLCCGLWGEIERQAKQRVA